MTNKLTTTLILLTLLLARCADDFLDLKRDKKQVIPKTIADHQALLDNTTTINLSSSLLLNVIGGEEYTVTDDVWSLLSSTTERNAYIWKADVFEGGESDDWNRAYSRVLYANSALDGIAKISPNPTEKQAWNQVKGSALFIRSYAFYQLAQTFCKPYVEATAATDAGIPLRVEADITLPVERASVKESYQRILEDLKTAAQLLPIKAITKFRPNKAAAYALLVKTYMHLADYPNALSYADSCLAVSEGLLDYNGLDKTLRYTFSTMRYGDQNPEVLYTESIPGVTIVNSTRFILNPDLYALYEATDLRKALFFYPTRGTYTFKGSYGGSYNFFGGIALDEVVLARAECYARLDQNEKALSALNEFLKKRYQSGAFTPLNITDKASLLERMIQERRKELLCRGIRWEDLRRYNQETSQALSITRSLKGQQYVLIPGGTQYVWPIPDAVIKASGVKQNPR